MRLFVLIFLPLQYNGNNPMVMEEISMARVLIIGDLHLPAVHPDYLEFCKSLKKKYRTNQTVFIGDVVDLHSISFHKKHPESDAAILEYEKAMSDLKEWKRAFPVASVCIGNHDERIHRLAADSGIPPMYLRDYHNLYDTEVGVGS
jgi:UDP-2,3-diacylglucosamine pyrophosphatase LpxH